MGGSLQKWKFPELASGPPVFDRLSGGAAGGVQGQIEGSWLPVPKKKKKITEKKKKTVQPGLLGLAGDGVVASYGHSGPVLRSNWGAGSLSFRRATRRPSGGRPLRGRGRVAQRGSMCGYAVRRHPTAHIEGQVPRRPLKAPRFSRGGLCRRLARRATEREPGIKY